MIGSLSFVLLAAFGVFMWPSLRRALRLGTVKTTARDATTDLPADRQHLPEPPVLPAAPVQILETAEIFRRVRELELGVAELGRALPEHVQILAAALTGISDPATQRRYFPRRPNLLPKLMRAVQDEDVSRRELAAIIATDPSLVGSLLKMANSSFYRVSPQPVETIDRAIVLLGNDGLRSLITAALMQPIFHSSTAGAFPRFPEIVWDHALRSAHAAIPHAAIVERADAFAAELLSLISGLAEIALFRAALDYWARSTRPIDPDPFVIASLLDAQAPAFAWQIGASWELSELMLGALEEQMTTSEPTTPLGRSLRFGRCAGALAVLYANSVIDDGTVRLSLPESGLSLPHLKSMWARLLQRHEDPRLAASPQR